MTIAYKKYKCLGGYVIYQEAWELPSYIDEGIIVGTSHDDTKKFRMKLGQFASFFVKTKMDLKLVDFKWELEQLTDFELGEQFMVKELYYGRVKKFKSFESIDYIVEQYGEDKLFSDLGFAIRGRIPYTYTKWYLKDHEISPAQVTYEMAKKVWGWD